MAIKTFSTGEILTASDTNTYLANGGLVYIGATTFPGNTTFVDISNVFSATYQNYKIVFTQGQSSTTYENIRFRYLAAGTPNTGDYFWASNFGTWGGVAGIQANNGGANTYGFAVNTINGGLTSSFDMDIFRPHNTAITSWRVHGQGNDCNWVGAGYHNVSASYDGIRFYLPAGNISGLARFYGYRQA